MSEFFDRDGDGKHTLSNVTHAGGEISDATKAGFQKVGAAAEDMMETLSTMTWDEDEKPSTSLAQKSSMVRSNKRAESVSSTGTNAAWSLKTYLKEKGEEIKAAFEALHEKMEQSASDARAAMDHNSNGTVSLGDVKNNMVDSAKATKEAISNAAQAIEDKIDSDGDGDADMQGVKQAFHRAAENMKASLEAFGDSMSEFFDRNGDGKHTLSNVTHAGGEISDATKAGFQKVGAAAEDMMETLSTMTWDEEDVEDEASAAAAA